MAIPTKCIMLFVVFAIVTEPMMRYGTMIIEKIGKRITLTEKSIPLYFTEVCKTTGLTFFAARGELT